jgi:maltose O-acetyltransferase
MTSPSICGPSLNQVSILSILKRCAHSFRVLVYYGLARYLPESRRPCGHVWRRIRSWSCRPLLLHCGDNVNIERGASLGRRTVSIGSNSGIGVNAVIGPGTTLGSNVMMGPDVVILTQNHETSRLDIPMVAQGHAPIAPVTVGDNVWIGTRVIILPGVIIGSGCVLGAGAVVSRNVPDGAVAVGNPARIVRYRHLAEPPDGSSANSSAQTC